MAPANSWTREQRLALHLLHAELGIDWDTLAIVFNTKFEAELRSCGFEDDIGRSALESQYRDRTRKLKNWADIIPGPVLGWLDPERQQLKAELRTIVNNLDPATEPLRQYPGYANVPDINNGFQKTRDELHRRHGFDPDYRSTKSRSNSHAATPTAVIATPINSTSAPSQPTPVASSNAPATTVNGEEEPTEAEEDGGPAVTDMRDEVAGEPETEPTGDGGNEQDKGEDSELAGGDANEVGQEVQDVTSEGGVDRASDTATAGQASDGKAMSQPAGHIEEDQDNPSAVEDEKPLTPTTPTAERTKTPVGQNTEGSSSENYNDVGSEGVVDGVGEKGKLEFYFAPTGELNPANNTELYDPNDSAFRVTKAMEEDLDTHNATGSDFNSFMPRPSFTNPLQPMWSADPPSYPATHPGLASEGDPMPTFDEEEQDPEDELAIYLPQMGATRPPSSPKPLLSSRHETGYTHQMFEGFDAIHVSYGDSGAEKRDWDDSTGLEESGRPAKAPKVSD